MKIFMMVILACILNVAVYSQENNELVEKYKQEVIDVETAFSKMSAEKGMKEAFLHYAADDVIKLRGGNQYPVMGIEELEKDFGEFDPANAPKLTWKPVKADASASGDLGYTFGSWVIEGKDAEGNPKKGYGVYMTIWKRQADGSWKFVLDGGNSTPPPGE